MFDVAAKYLVVDCIMYEYVPTHDAESNQLMSIHNNFSFEFKSVRFVQLASDVKYIYAWLTLNTSSGKTTYL